jgi:hypothetical protein
MVRLQGFDRCVGIDRGDCVGRSRSEIRVENAPDQVNLRYKSTRLWKPFRVVSHALPANGRSSCVKAGPARRRRFPRRSHDGLLADPELTPSRPPRCVPLLQQRCRRQSSISPRAGARKPNPQRPAQAAACLDMHHTMWSLDALRRLGCRRFRNPHVCRFLARPNAPARLLPMPALASHQCAGSRRRPLQTQRTRPAGAAPP